MNRNFILCMVLEKKKVSDEKLRRHDELSLKSSISYANSASQTKSPPMLFRRITSSLRRWSVVMFSSAFSEIPSG